VFLLVVQLPQSRDGASRAVRTERTTRPLRHL
jgi:hypothetical protein